MREISGGVREAGSGCVARSRGAHVAAWLLSLAGVPALVGQIASVDPDAHYPEGPLWRQRAHTVQ
jgi:hypothetical protein